LTKSSFDLNKLNDLHIIGDVIERKMEIINNCSPGLSTEVLKAQWLEKRSASEMKKSRDAKEYATATARQSSWMQKSSRKNNKESSMKKLGFTERNSINIESDNNEFIAFSKQLVFCKEK